MGETGIQHDNAESSLIVISRRSLCVECPHNRGTRYTPVCAGPRLNGRSIAPCTLSRMLQDSGANCYHDDESWRQRWKNAELDTDGDCNGSYDMPERKTDPTEPRIVKPRVVNRRNGDVAVTVYPATGGRW